MTPVINRHANSISNQSHALDFGRELQKLHTHKKMHFQQKVHAYRMIAPSKTRGPERDEQPEKEENMVEDSERDEKQNGRKGRRA